MSRNLQGAVPEVLLREIGGGHWAGEDVVGGVGGGVALGTEVGVGDSDGVSVGVQAGTLAGSELGEGDLEVAGKGGLGWGDAGGRPPQDPVPAAVGEVGCDGGSVDAADGGAVAGWVGGSVILQVLRDFGEEGRLEERDSGPRAWVLGDQGQGRVG